MRRRNRFERQPEWILLLAPPQAELITASGVKNPAFVAGPAHLKHRAAGYAAGSRLRELQFRRCLEFGPGLGAV